jgi:hypothetical protein
VGSAPGHRRRQGVDTVTSALAHQVTLTESDLLMLADRLAIHDFPTVLAIRATHATIEQRRIAGDRATRGLMSRNLIVAGDVQPDLVPLLKALHRPDRELAMRLVTPDGTARFTAVRRGSLNVLARRVGDDISFRVLNGSVEMQDVASALVAGLPHIRPADIEPVVAPLQELSESLSGAYDSTALADRIRLLGVESQAAMLLGAAFASREAFAEIVHYALADDVGRISRTPAAVAVFYTKRGRIVAAPSASPSGQLWTTLKPASDHAVVQAIGRLVELSNQEWGE